MSASVNLFLEADDCKTRLRKKSQPSRTPARPEKKPQYIYRLLRVYSTLLPFLLLSLTDPSSLPRRRINLFLPPALSWSCLAPSAFLLPRLHRIQVREVPRRDGMRGGATARRRSWRRARMAAVPATRLDGLRRHGPFLLQCGWRREARCGSFYDSFFPGGGWGGSDCGRARSGVGTS